MPGYFHSEGVCIKCNVECSRCSNKSVCSSCIDGYLLVGESCEISLYNLTIDIDQQINKIIIRLYSKVIIINTTILKATFENDSINYIITY